MPVKLRLNGEPGTSLGEYKLIRLALERQNELLEELIQTISIKK